MRRFLTALPPKGDAPEAPSPARTVPSPAKQPKPTPPAAAAPSPKPASAEPASADPVPKPKKQRTSNPGVRQVGGRIYDSETGTTCHQCRQKTVEVKAKCRSCPLYFCPRCMGNRYNENVEEVNALPAWACPRCRKLCNCSNCRKKAGLAATGILATVAKAAGLGSVSELLAKNPEAQAAHMKEQAARAPKAPKPPQEPKAPKAPKRKAAAPEALLVDDATLPPRPTPMPAGEALALYSPAGATEAKRPRRAPLPEDVDAGELACVLEFAAAFATTPALGFESALDLAALGAELTRPAAAEDPLPNNDSLAVILQAKLLGIVRGAWGPSAPAPETIALEDWQGLMRGYYAEAAVLSASDVALLRDMHGPLAVVVDALTGDSASTDAASPTGSSDATGTGSDSGSPGSDATKTTANKNSKRAPSRHNSASPEYLAATAAAAEAAAFPDGGYWAVAPGTRVNMAYALLHDALETFTLRDAIDKAMEAAAEADKERRAELAAVQRAAKEAAARQRDQEIAVIVADNGAKGMNLEEQKAVVEEARRKAAEATAAAAAAKVKALSHVALPPCVRTAQLGVDRDGAAVWKLAAAEALTGAPAGLVVASEGAAAGTLRAVADGEEVTAALDPRGRREGPLRHAIALACGLTLNEPKDLPPLPQAQPKSPKPAKCVSPAAVAATVENSAQGGATAVAAS